MKTAISNYPSVAARAEELGLALPFGLVLLPVNFEIAQPGDELRFTAEAVTVGKILAQGGLGATRLGAETRPEVYIHNRSADWIIPLIFVGGELAKTPDIFAAAIGLIQTYLIDHLKGPGSSGGKKVKAEIVVENSKTGECRRISYDGDASGLKDLAKVVAAASRK